jgi:hypothetical protein
MKEENRRPDGTQSGDDRLMMESPEFWVNWPILTLKKRSVDGSPSELGLLYNEAMGRSILRFLGPCIIGTVEMRDLAKAPEADIDKLLVDGWVVD